MSQRQPRRYRDRCEKTGAMPPSAQGKSSSQRIPAADAPLWPALPRGFGRNTKTALGRSEDAAVAAALGKSPTRPRADTPPRCGPAAPAEPPSGAVWRPVRLTAAATAILEPTRLTRAQGRRKQAMDGGSNKKTAREIKRVPLVLSGWPDLAF
jgi:hypothetical protein